jgi:hypothetical protein
MGLSRSGRIGTAEIEEICELRDDVYRNQWITFAYWTISQRLRGLIGTNASWCTFSTWSSRTIGQNLRLDNANRRVEELVLDPHTAVSRADNRFVLRLQYRVSTRDDGAAQRVLALGNRLIFHEIGYAVTAFLDWADRNPTFDPAAWADYRASITPYEESDLFPAADVEQLRDALECYYVAAHTPGAAERAELVLRGNVLLAAYEQWRVDPMLKVALDPWPGRFLRAVRANPHAAAELSLPDAGTPWALRHRSPILRALSAHFGAAMTRWVMALDAPLFIPQIRTLRVGRAIPAAVPGARPVPSSLEHVGDPELARLVGVYDRSGGSAAGVAARNWTRFTDRMNFIVNLFRAGQPDEHLYQPLPEAELHTLDLDLSDDRLDALRRVGDPEVDELIDGHCSAESLSAREFLGSLITGGLATTESLDPGPSELPAWVDDEQLRAGQAFFREYGIEAASALFCAALPKSYTAGRGGRVLTTTAALVSDAQRRVAETGEMLLDAMAFDDTSAEPLRPDSRAYQAARGVRLFHGAVRHTILAQPELRWSQDELGVPINQEDLLGTLAAFTVTVIASLDEMGVTCTVEDRDAYLHLWLAIGHLLGVDYDRLYREPPPSDRQPLTYADMQLLARIIFDRNAEASPGGQELMAALLHVSEQSMPFPMKGLPRALTRRLIGPEAADMLGVPPPGAMRLMIAALRPVNAVVSPFVHSNLLGGLANSVARRLYRGWIDDGHGERPPWRFDSARPDWLEPARRRAAARGREIASRSRALPRRARTMLSEVTGGRRA